MDEKNTEEHVNKNLKLIVKSSFIVFIGLFLSKILAYVYRIIIARYFGPEVYGLFSLAIMVLGWFVAISSLGLADGLGRFIPLYRGKKEYNKIKYLLRVSITILLFSSIISATILFLSAKFISMNFFHNSDLIIFLKIFSFLIPILIFSNLLLCILRAFEKIAWHSFILNILQNIMKLLVLILLIFLGLKTTSIIFSYFLGTLIILLTAYLVCKYKISEIFGKYNLNKKIKKKTITNFTSYSFPLLFLSIFSLLFAWIDSFSIGYLMGVLAVGFYNAAIPIALLMGVIPELFGSLFSPLIIKNFSQKNFKVIKELSQQVSKWIFIFNLPLFLIVILFPGAIINLLFGSNYIIAENALRILIIGYFISSLSFVSGNLVGMMGKSKLILMNIVVTSIIN
ncbi:MAG: flippase, partial [Nanoarchaeota archaeon]|nr:flippase [Nanoarchaeota archaeon]